MSKVGVRSATKKTARKRWEEFKLEWMLDHGYTIADIINEVSKVLDDDPDLTLQEAFETWEDEYGFNYELWPCFEEWEENDMPLLDD